MTKAMLMANRMAALPVAEREVVDEFSVALRRHQKQGPTRLAELARVAFEVVLTSVSKPSREGKLALAMARGIEARQKLAEAEGGSLSSEEVARMLNISKTAVLKRLEAGKLLAWREERLKAARFPRWQFDDRGTLLNGMSETLACLNDNPHLDDWAKVLFYLQNRPDSDELRPLDLLRKGRVKEAVQAAHAYAD